jgi:hypothetical protein
MRNIDTLKGKQGVAPPTLDPYIGYVYMTQYVRWLGRDVMAESIGARQVRGSYRLKITRSNWRSVVGSLDEMSGEDKMEVARVMNWYSMRSKASEYLNEIKVATIPGRTGTDHRVPAKYAVVPTSMQDRMADLKAGRKVKMTKLGKVEVPYLSSFQRWAPRGYKLYSQQLYGAAALVTCDRYALWYDMRTGKTATAITAANYYGGTVIVIAPAPNLLDPWEHELRSDMWDVTVLNGTLAEDLEALSRSSGRRAFVLSYERAYSRLKDYDLEGVTLIADETSKAQNALAKRTKDLFWIAARCARVYVLNGTPIGMSPANIYVQTRLIDPWGLELGASLDDFISDYCAYINNGSGFANVNDLIVRHDAVDSFAQAQMWTSLRVIRKQADQFLGKDKRRSEVVTLVSEEMRQYMLLVLQGIVKLPGSEEMGQVTKHVLAIRSAMREATSGVGKYLVAEGTYRRFLLHESLGPIGAAVMNRVLNNPDTPFIIYTNFNESEDRLRVAFMEAGIKVVGRKANPSWTISKRVRGRIPVKVLTQVIPNLESEELRDVCKHIEKQARIASAEDVLLPGFVRESPEFIDSLIAATGGVSTRIASLLSKLAALRDDPAASKGEKESAQARIDEINEKYKRDARSLKSEYVEEYKVIISGKKLSDVAFADAINDFNEGRARVIIMKATQARGFSLHAMPAQVKLRCKTPVIIYMSPPESLDSLRQSEDRAVRVYPANFWDKEKAGKNQVTPVYMYVVGGTIDEVVLGRLKERSDASDFLLNDIEALGGDKFTTELQANLEKMSAEDLWDEQEATSRIIAGVPPEAKLSPGNISKFFSHKWGRNPTKEALDAKQYLLGRTEAKAQTREDDVEIPDAPDGSESGGAEGRKALTSRDG